MLEKLHSTLSGRLPHINMRISCADQLDRKFFSIDDLQVFDNPERAAIVTLEISAQTETGDQWFLISLGRDRPDNVRVSFNANEENGLSLNAAANDIIDSLRPWYSWVALADWYWIVFGGWMLYNLLSIAFWLLPAGETPIAFSWDSRATVNDLLKALAIGFVPIAVGLLLNIVRDRYFPLGVFAIGQGKMRHAAQETIRTVWIAGLAVSVVTTVVVSWFA